jgi:hypothetical protein
MDELQSISSIHGALLSVSAAGCEMFQKVKSLLSQWSEILQAMGVAPMQLGMVTEFARRLGPIDNRGDWLCHVIPLAMFT